MSLIKVAFLTLMAPYHCLLLVFQVKVIFHFLSFIQKVMSLHWFKINWLDFRSFILYFKERHFMLLLLGGIIMLLKDYLKSMLLISMSETKAAVIIIFLLLFFMYINLFSRHTTSCCCRMGKLERYCKITPSQWNRCRRERQ